MEKEQTFEEKLKESQEEFIAQFDPNSEKHHKGCPKPVPLWGKKIPESMPQEYPEVIPETINPSDLGEEYSKIEKKRECYLNIKKILAKQSQLTEAIYRHNMTFKEKGDKNNLSHVEKHN